MKQEQLNKILENHALWLKAEGGERVNLEGASLEDANLVRANLEYANLEDANLEYANLGGANLEGANLEGANLEGANLEGANLEGANLRGAYLEGADLRGANLEDATLDYQLQPNLLQQIAETVLSGTGELEMGTWHSCETTHCLAGWACHLNETAKQLEKTHGTQIAGLLTLGQEAHSYFFKGNEEALDWLKKVTHKPDTSITARLQRIEERLTAIEGKL